MDHRTLLNKAIEAKEMAYAPYSHVKVGAALLTATGKVFTGCNVENASFGATNCAERTAIFKAISEGEQSFVAIAVASSLEEPISPCGICRQVIMEFGRNIDIILGNETALEVFSSDQMLPHAFHKDDLEEQA